VPVQAPLGRAFVLKHELRFAGGELKSPPQAMLGQGTLQITVVSARSSMAGLSQALCLGQAELRFCTLGLQ